MRDRCGVQLRFICALAFLASMGWIYLIVCMWRYGAAVTEMLLRACDLVTIAVPPALPAAICIGLEMAMMRLKVSPLRCDKRAPLRRERVGRVGLA